MNNNNASNGGDVDKNTMTPEKSGITRPALATTRTAMKTPPRATVAAAAAAEGEEGRTPTATPATAVATRGPLPSFSFNAVTSTLTPPVTSTKGIRTKGKKAVGAGALSVARSPLVGGSADAGADLSKNTTESPISIPQTGADDDVADKQVYGITKQESEQVESQEESHEETEHDGVVRFRSSMVLDARSLQHRVRSQLPEFGISEWSPPPPPQGAAAGLATKPREAATVDKTKALKELSTLRSQADVKLEGTFITRIIGQGGDNEPKRSKEEYTLLGDKDDDTLCQGVRSAFRVALPELTIPSATPEAAALPSTSLSKRTTPTTRTSVSPLERGTRRGWAAGGEKVQYSHVADRIEERLERLKLLRNQAIQVTSTSTSTTCQ